jgi:hypothetical protein
MKDLRQTFPEMDMWDDKEEERLENIQMYDALPF